MDRESVLPPVRVAPQAVGEDLKFRLLAVSHASRPEDADKANIAGLLHVCVYGEMNGSRWCPAWDTVDSPRRAAVDAAAGHLRVLAPNALEMPSTVLLHSDMTLSDV